MSVGSSSKPRKNMKNMRPRLATSEKKGREAAGKMESVHPGS
jgi:hypothetical protein